MGVWKLKLLVGGILIAKQSESRKSVNRELPSVAIRDITPFQKNRFSRVARSRHDGFCGTR
jgi:hypothetical protein